MIIRDKKKGERGFSLLEVVAALGVLSIAIFGVLSLYMSGLRSFVRSVRLTEAGMILQSVAESQKLVDYDAGAEALTSVPAEYAQGFFKDYRYKIDVVVDPEGWSEKRITVQWSLGGLPERVTTVIFTDKEY